MDDLLSIKAYASREAVPIMQDEGCDFICEYIKEHNCKNILEIGTAIGYSSIRFAKLADDIRVTTIELDIDRHIKDNLGLVSVSGTAIHLGAFLPIATGEQERNCRGQLGFALLFGDLNVRRVILPVPVFLDGAEHVPDHRLLPRQKVERLAVPFAFGMLQRTDKRDRAICKGGIRYDSLLGNQDSVLFQTNVLL